MYQEYEENSRETLITKILQEAKNCIQMGIWNWCQTVHERLRVEEKEIVFRKNRDFTYPKNGIHRITITVSRFVHPHLWLYEREGELEIIKAYTSEPMTQGLPEDFLRLFQALGERTRLAIVSELMKKPQSTKELAERLILTEAAISRHLKILQEAGLVAKHREGKSMIYEFRTDMIDFLPYQFYETMYQGKRRK